MPRHVHPPVQVPSAIRARNAAVLADREEDAAARAHQFLGDLAAGVSAAHDKHGTVRQLIGIAVPPACICKMPGVSGRMSGTTGRWNAPVATTTFAARIE